MEGQNEKLTLRDFQIIKDLGIGSYGRVELVKRKEDQNQLNDLIFESETDLADGYFLGGFRNYLKDHCNLKNKNSINKKKVANNKQSKYIVKNDFDDKFNKNCTLKTKDNMNFEDLLNKYDIDELDVEDINAEIFIDSAEI